MLRLAHTHCLCSHEHNSHPCNISISHREFSSAKRNIDRKVAQTMCHTWYVLARSIRSNLQFQAAAGIGVRGAGNMAVRGKCMERATQMFSVKGQEDIPRAVVEALLRY